MSTSSVTQGDSSCSNSISSPESGRTWSPSEDDSVLCSQPNSPILPIIKSERPRRGKAGTFNVTNKKERKRTQNINTAFSDLRHCIPNVPMDTKLSKIKTLRLAISYMQHLMQQMNDHRYHFPMAEVKPFIQNSNYYQHFPKIGRPEKTITSRGIKRAFPDRTKEYGQRRRGRTGWPQLVWALELSQ